MAYPATWSCYRKCAQISQGKCFGGGFNFSWFKPDLNVFSGCPSLLLYSMVNYWVGSKISVMAINRCGN